MPRNRNLHGVLLRVHGLGVLLAGPPGIGKGALALELLSRGHVLVADDAVEIRRTAAGFFGRCPAPLKGWLAVRELGLLDVRALYGAKALRVVQRLDLVIRLGRRRPLGAAAQLAGRRSVGQVLGQSVPALSLSVGHNLAARVEAACLDQRLRKSGIASERVFARRQQQRVHRNAK